MSGRAAARGRTPARLRASAFGGAGRIGVPSRFEGDQLRLKPTVGAGSPVVLIIGRLSSMMPVVTSARAIALLCAALVLLAATGQPVVYSATRSVAAWAPRALEAVAGYSFDAATAAAVLAVAVLIHRLTRWFWLALLACSLAVGGSAYAARPGRGGDAADGGLSVAPMAFGEERAIAVRYPQATAAGGADPGAPACARRGEWAQLVGIGFDVRPRDPQLPGMDGRWAWTAKAQTRVNREESPTIKYLAVHLIDKGADGKPCRVRHLKPTPIQVRLDWTLTRVLESMRASAGRIAFDAAAATVLFLLDAIGGGQRISAAVARAARRSQAGLLAAAPRSDGAP